MSVSEGKWRIEKTENTVGFWIDHQGFTVYRKDDSVSEEENKGLIDFYGRSLVTALSRLKPENTQ